MLLNDSVRSCQHIRRNREPDLLRRFQIDDEFELLRLLDGEISRRSAFEDFVHVRSGAAKQVANAYAVRHKPTLFDIFWPAVCRREPTLCREVQNLLSLRIEDGAP